MARKLIIVVAALFLLPALPARAAFDNVDVSPRARGMGDAFTATADDAFAPYFNPAGMALQARSSLGNSYVEPYGLDFHDLLYFGGVLPIGERYGAVGFGIRRYATEYQGQDLETETTFTVAHGIKLYEDLHSTIALGTAVNVYRLEFGQTVSGLDPGDDVVAGIDLSVLVVLHRRTRLGFMIHNVNNPQIGLDQEEIPQRLHGAVAYEPYSGVTTSFEVENTVDGETQYHGGIEFTVLDVLHLRSGVMTNPNKLAAGFGYDYQGLRLDYAFTSGGGTLDATHQFGLTFTWGGETP